jgi:hypothetical protein
MHEPIQGGEMENQGMSGKALLGLRMFVVAQLLATVSILPAGTDRSIAKRNLTG